MSDLNRIDNEIIRIRERLEAINQKFSEGDKRISELEGIQKRTWQTVSWGLSTIGALLTSGASGLFVYWFMQD